VYVVCGALLFLPVSLAGAEGTGPQTTEKQLGKIKNHCIY
jgi:hypothetical protein